MSDTYKSWPLTNYPDSLDVGNANIRTDILDFADRAPTTLPELYHVMAGDVKSLQQAIFAIQNVLGTMPQSAHTTVDTRIEALEDYTDLDIRYIGINSPQPAPTIMSHIHVGTPNGPPKIDLTNHVTGVLNKANINLLKTSPASLTAEDIYLTHNQSAPSILDKFTEKLDKTGGKITGIGLDVEASFNSGVFKEIDAADTLKTVGSNIYDTSAFSSTARKGVKTDARGELLNAYITRMRYLDYSIGIRAKVTNASITQSIGKIEVYSGSALSKSVEIIPNNFFNTTGYEMIYIPFSHKGPSNFSVRIVITWYGTSASVPCDLFLDGIVINPVHLAAYDME